MICISETFWIEIGNVYLTESQAFESGSKKKKKKKKIYIYIYIYIYLNHFNFCYVSRKGTYKYK